MNSILWNGKMRVENQTKAKLESEKTRVYARKPRLKLPFKNSISGLSCISTSFTPALLMSLFRATFRYTPRYPKLEVGVEGCGY
jgi:hypothetical protein